MEITYKGWRDQQRSGPMTVYRIEDGKSFTGRTKLDPAASQKIVNHSPDGFQWGFGGSGPAQLALALVLDATGDKNRARKVYQDFKDAFVARWLDQWVITQAEIVAWVNEQPVVQCTPICARVREDYAAGTISEDKYVLAMCEIHFAEYQDRQVAAEGEVPM